MGRKPKGTSFLIVNNAAIREAELLYSMQAEGVDLVLRQQLEQVRQELVGSQPEVENRKGSFIHWEDQAAQDEARADELAKR